MCVCLCVDVFRSVQTRAVCISVFYLIYKALLSAIRLYVCLHARHGLPVWHHCGLSACWYQPLDIHISCIHYHTVTVLMSRGEEPRTESAGIKTKDLLQNLMILPFLLRRLSLWDCVSGRVCVCVFERVIGNYLPCYIVCTCPSSDRFWLFWLLIFKGPMWNS